MWWCPSKWTLKTNFKSLNTLIVMCLSCKVGITIGQILILEPQWQVFGWRRKINGGEVHGGGGNLGIMMTLSTTTCHFKNLASNTVATFSYDKIKNNHFHVYYKKTINNKIK
jgi:hypothetical protein